MTKENILERANQCVGQTLTHAQRGLGTIMNVSLGSDNVCATIKFGDKEIQMAVGLAKDRFEDCNAKSILINCDNQYKEILVEEKQEKARQYELEQQALEDMKKAKKLQEKIEKAKSNAIKQMHDLEAHRTTRNATSEEEAWLLENLSVSAAMPESQEAWFKRLFPNAKYRAVNQEELTSGGFLKQWTLGMSATVKKDADLEKAPDYIAKNIIKEKSTMVIRNTQLLFDLCLEYDLPIGKNARK